MNLIVLDIAFSYNGVENHLYPVVLKNSKETILVDCGYAGFMPLLEAALHQQGLSLSELTGLTITHHDMDHMGCAYELKDAFPSVKVYASEGEAAYVDGREKSLRLQQAEAIYDSLPEEQKPGAKAFEESLRTIRPVKVDATFSDKDEPVFLPGVLVIHTPGHMPGHISLYLTESKTLVAADALVYQDGELEIANPAFTMDMSAAIDSVRKLQQLAIEKIICYHGGVTDNDIQSKLGKLLARYR